MSDVFVATEWPVGDDSYDSLLWESQLHRRLFLHLRLLQRFVVVVVVVVFVVLGILLSGLLLDCVGEWWYHCAVRVTADGER